MIGAFKPRPQLLLPLLVAALGVALYLLDPLPVQVLRNTLFDQYQRWHPRSYTAAPVTIVDIDDQSLEMLGQWPWPRTFVAQLIDTLQRAGTAAVGLDIIFAEPDRTSPSAMLALWDVSEEMGRQIAALPDHDQILAQVMTQGGVVVGFSVKRDGTPGAPPRSPFRVVNVGEAPAARLHPFSSAVTSLPLFESAAAGNGALTFVPDGDGVVRRVPLLLRLGDEVIPSLVAEALRVGQGAKNYLLKAAPERGTGLQEVKIGNAVVPTTPRGEMWVHFTASAPERYIPAWKVLMGEIPAERLRGQFVLVGTSAQGLMDLRFSPRGEIIPGVELHAQALEQILSGDYLERPTWAHSIEVLALLIGALVAGLVALHARVTLSALVTLALLGTILWGAWSAFADYRLLLDPVLPALTTLTAFVLAGIVHHFSTERRQRWVKGAFSRYVSPNLVSYLVDNPQSLELGGRRQQCSFIFTDLAGFTTLMESIDPGEAVALLNTYLDEMIRIAFAHQGTLDRIVGDAVAIMFSAPVFQPDHQRRALACALEMDAFGRRYAEQVNARGIPFGKTRIGIHTGEVIVGNFGGSTMFDYRALGDPVNTAARLESVNKHLGTHVCLSEATLEGCPDACVRPVGRLVLKGKSRPLMVYEPLAEGPDEAYEAAFRLLRDQAPEARVAFAALAWERPDDPLVDLHRRRLEAGERGELIVMAEK